MEDPEKDPTARFFRRDFEASYLFKHKVALVNMAYILGLIILVVVSYPVKVVVDVWTDVLSETEFLEKKRLARTEASHDHAQTVANSGDVPPPGDAGREDDHASSEKNTGAENRGQQLGAVDHNHTGDETSKEVSGINNQLRRGILIVVSGYAMIWLFVVVMHLYPVFSRSSDDYGGNGEGHRKHPLIHGLGSERTPHTYPILQHTTTLLCILVCVLLDVDHKNVRCSTWSTRTTATTSAPPSPAPSSAGGHPPRHSVVGWLLLFYNAYVLRTFFPHTDAGYSTAFTAFFLGLVINPYRPLLPLRAGKKLGRYLRAYSLFVLLFLFICSLPGALGRCDQFPYNLFYERARFYLVDVVLLVLLYVNFWAVEVAGDAVDLSTEAGNKQDQSIGIADVSGRKGADVEDHGNRDDSSDDPFDIIRPINDWALLVYLFHIGWQRIWNDTSRTVGMFGLWPLAPFFCRWHWRRGRRKTTK